MHFWVRCYRTPVYRGMEIFYQERLASDDGEAAKKALQEIAATRAGVFQREWAARQARR